MVEFELAHQIPQIFLRERLHLHVAACVWLNHIRGPKSPPIHLTLLYLLSQLLNREIHKNYPTLVLFLIPFNARDYSLPLLFLCLQ